MSRSKRKPYYYIECIKPKTVIDLKRTANRTERRQAKIDVYKDLNSSTEKVGRKLSCHKKRYSMRNYGLFKFFYDSDINSSDEVKGWALKISRK